jgi:hypothetical protein
MEKTAYYMNIRKNKSSVPQVYESAKKQHIYLLLGTTTLREPWPP